MKTALAALALALAAPALAQDLELEPPPARELTWRWSSADLALEGALAGLIAVDWLQTLQFTQHDCRTPELGGGCYETNPVLGRYPSRAKVNTLIPLGLAAHAAVAALIPQGPWRFLWQGTFLVLESKAVTMNAMYGVQLRLPW